MPVKINGTTSGSTTITAPASGADETIELSTALAAKTNKVGSVLQVVSVTKSDTFTTTSTTFTDVTGLSASITPSSATSKILVMVTIGSLNQSDGAAAGRVNLVRGSTTILQPSSGSLPASLQFYSANQFEPSNGSLSILDSPNTTSAVTYKIQVAIGSGTIAVNRRVVDTNLNAPSTITLLEVGQ